MMKPNKTYPLSDNSGLCFDSASKAKAATGYDVEIQSRIIAGPFETLELAIKNAEHCPELIQFRNFWRAYEINQPNADKDAPPYDGVYPNIENINAFGTSAQADGYYVHMKAWHKLPQYPCLTERFSASSKIKWAVSSRDAADMFGPCYGLKVIRVNNGSSLHDKLVELFGNTEALRVNEGYIELSYWNVELSHPVARKVSDITDEHEDFANSILDARRITGQDCVLHTADHPKTYKSAKMRDKMLGFLLNTHWGTPSRSKDGRYGAKVTFWMPKEDSARLFVSERMALAQGLKGKMYSEKKQLGLDFGLFASVDSGIFGAGDDEGSGRTMGEV